MIEKESTVSLAMFGAVAMMMTHHHRQSSSSEDLEEDHLDVEKFVRSVPKIELHVHLDGAFDPQQLWLHLQEKPDFLQCFPVEKELPWAKAGEGPLQLRKIVEGCETSLDYRRLCTCRRRYRKLRTSEKSQMNNGSSPQGTLEDMLTCFEFFFPLVYDNLDLLEHLAFDFVKRQYEQNVIYTEVRYSPHLLAKDAREAHKAVTKGLRRGCKVFGIIVNQIMCGINFSGAWSKEVVEMANDFKGDFPCAVVGIDIAAGEDHFSVENPNRKGHLDMCRRAQELGLNITLHAGETPNSAQNVQTAINEYGATRIGHGYHITDHPEIMDLVKSKNIHIEVCPTSSVETGGWEKTNWIDHPACIFRDNELSVSLSSDDPAVFNTSLTWQYRIALKKMRWTERDVLETLEDAIDAAFMPDYDKEKLRKKVQDFVIVQNPLFTDRVHYD